MKIFKRLFVCLIAVLIVLPFGILSSSAIDFREIVVDSKASVGYDDDKETVGVDKTQRKSTEYTSMTHYTNQSGFQNVNVRATQHTTYTATVPAILIVDGSFRPNDTNNFAYQASVAGNLAGDVQILLQPDESFELTSIGKNNIVASITQEKTKFTYDDGVRLDNPITTTGNGAVQNMTAGLWYGCWNFNIRMLPIYTTESYTWKDDDYTTGEVTGITDIGAETYETYGIMMFPEVGSVEGFEGVKTINTQDSNLFDRLERDDCEIFIPNTVERIEDGMLNTNGPFYKAKASKITFEQPSSLKYIGRYAFCYATVKEPITIPASVEELGYRSFNCINYSSENLNARKYLPLYIAEGSRLKTIGQNAFSYSLFEGTIELPQTVETIGDGAFQHCFFSEIKIPDTVTTIGPSAFDTCQDRKGKFEVNIPKYVQKWNDAYTRCYDLTIEIPNTIKTIPAGAFYSAYLQTITLPEGIEEIGTNAFLSSRLTSISLPSTLKIIGYQAFAGTSFTKLTIPDGVEEIGGSAFWNTKALTEITLGSGLKTVYETTFSNAPALKTIKINGLPRIPEKAFMNCAKLETVQISSGLTAIGANAFSGCSKLATVNFTGTIDEWLAVKMEGSASDPTYYSKNLKINNQFVTELNFKPNPDDFVYSWSGKYVAWTQLKKVVIKAGTEIIPDYIFQNCMWLSSVSLPSSLKEIGSSSFSGCTALKNITLPKNLEIIGNNAFSSSGLTYIAIPTSVQEIGNNAFKSCTSMTGAKAKILNNADGCFMNCSSLTTITLEDGTTHIPDCLARYCSKLTTINLPESLTYIGESPFGNTGLGSFEWHLSNNVTTIQQNAFAGTGGKVYIDNYPGSIEGYPWNTSNYQTRIVWMREAE